ncbi:MAG: uroporphyrinogen decarboxylase family protein [Eubacteriales bacterium]|nr:uroporphyrinogen decarboxylase family protein [Eubacteriales bacterium]
MEKMTHTQRVKAVLEGKPVDRYPFVAWGPHLNLEDKNVGDFTKAVIAYQNQHDFDILKVMQNGLYAVEDFGQVIAETEDSDDACYKKTVVTAFKSLEDWKNVTKKDVHKGAYGREVESIKILCDYYGDSVPVLPTIFGPQRLLGQLCGYPAIPGIYPIPCFVGSNLMEYAAQHEEEYFHVMDVLTEQVIDLMNAYLDVGAAGFFYCPGGDNPAFCTDAEYEKYVKPYDMRALSAIEGRAWFTMLHICGMSVAHMDRFVSLPAQAINWEDQSLLNPSLARVREMTDKVLMGGIDRNRDFYGSNREKVKAVLKEKTEEAIRQAGPKLIVSGGCECNRETTHRFVVWHEVMDEMAE